MHNTRNKKSHQKCKNSEKSPKPTNWSKEEDETLRKAVIEHEGKNWKKIAKQMPGRTDVQCIHRWQKVLNPGLVKGPWTPEEDQLVVQLVEKYGPRSWSVIAQHLNGRIGKQCRERWHNHLDPNINRSPWTEEEDELLIEKHEELGNKWAEISKYFNGRTDNMIKNHWNSTIRRRVFGTPGKRNRKRKPKKNSQKNRVKLQEQEKQPEPTQNNDTITKDIDSSDGSSFSESESFCWMDDVSILPDTMEFSCSLNETHIHSELSIPDLPSEYQLDNSSDILNLFLSSPNSINPPFAQSCVLKKRPFIDLDSSPDSSPVESKRRAPVDARSRGFSPSTLFGDNLSSHVSLTSSDEESYSDDSFTAPLFDTTCAASTQIAQF